MFVSKQKRDDAVPAVRLDTLRSVPLFRDFDQAELAEVARLVTTRRFAKHQTIFREGDPGHTFYLILSGSVAVVRIGPEGRETILSILKERDFFGEMSVLDTSARAAAVRTMTEVEVGLIEREDFLNLIDRNPKIGRLLVIALSERLRAANKLIAATTSQDIRSRLASLLLNLMQNFGEPAPNGTRIGLRLTNQEMANMIGTTRETVNRTLNRFWDERTIDMRTSHVIVVEPDRLRELVP
jgi:CRP-like cAMP-binding protein